MNETVNESIDLAKARNLEELDTTQWSSKRRDFLRMDPSEDVYVDPGASTCKALSKLNGGSIEYASRPGWGAYDPDLDDYGPGYYCGSYSSIGYGDTSIDPEWKLLGAIEGINGAILLGWTVAFFVTVMGRLLPSSERNTGFE